MTKMFKTYSPETHAANNEDSKCVYMSTKSGAADRSVPTAPTFCTHVMHLLMYVLHVHTYDGRTGMYVHQSRSVPTAPTFCTHVMHLLMYVLHVLTYDARTGMYVY